MRRNAACVGGNGGERFDLRPYDLEPGKWTFYAVTRAADGVVRFYQGGQGGCLYWMAENAPEISLKRGIELSELLAK